MEQLHTNTNKILLDILGTLTGTSGVESGQEEHCDENITKGNTYIHHAKTRQIMVSNSFFILCDENYIALHIAFFIAFSAFLNKTLHFISSSAC